MTDNKRNYLLLASLIMIWGSSFVLTDRSLLFFSPEQVVTYRLTIGALSMLLISLIYRKRLFVSIRPWFHFSFYSVNTIVAARLTSYDPIVSSTCVLILASLFSFLIWPESLSIAFNEIPLISLSSIILLGVLPTGIAAYIYFIIINSAGATFLANINYLIPVVAFFLGAILLGEEILIQNIIALIFIISGIFISRKNS